MVSFQGKMKFEKADLAAKIKGYKIWNIKTDAFHEDWRGSASWEHLTLNFSIFYVDC